MAVGIIWTPWRYDYVRSADANEGCIFCDRPAGDDRENLILHRGDSCFVILNRYPYTTGHVMVAPYRHTGTIEELSVDEVTEMMILAQRCMGAIRNAFRPDGFNLGINIARCAGAGVADHVHLHVVPRWSGDNNFMAVTGDTRVLPTDLDTAYSALIECF